MTLPLAAILLNWRDEESTWKQISRLQAWQKPPDIWLVENAPLRKPPPAGLHPVHHVAPGCNLGYAGGINAAWRAMGSSSPDTILLLNTDIELEEAVVIQLAEALANPALGVVGPLLVEPYGTGTRTLAGGRDPVRWVHTRLPFDSTRAAGGGLRMVDYVPGTVCLIRRGLMAQLGGLAEAFFFSGEVADFCLRARAAGFGCAVHTGVAVAHHTEAAGVDRDTLYLYYSLRNRFLLARRNRPLSWPFWWAVWTARGLGMAALRQACGKPAAARAARTALRDAWRGRFGPAGTPAL